MISVTGSGSENFTSDLIVWEGQFVRVFPVSKQAYEDLNLDKETVRKYLVEKGIPSENIVFNSVQTNEQRDNQYENGSSVGSTFRAYGLIQSVKIESTNVELIESVSREITELLNKGVQFNSTPPRYYYTKIADLKIEMISKATEDARIRATALSAVLTLLFVLLVPSATHAANGTAVDASVEASISENKSFPQNVVVIDHYAARPRPKAPVKAAKPSARKAFNKSARGSSRAGKSKMQKPAARSRGMRSASRIKQTYKTAARSRPNGRATSFKRSSLQKKTPRVSPKRRVTPRSAVRNSFKRPSKGGTIRKAAPTFAGSYTLRKSIK